MSVSNNVTARTTESVAQEGRSGEGKVEKQTRLAKENA